MRGYRWVIKSRERGLNVWARSQAQESGARAGAWARGASILWTVAETAAPPLGMSDLFTSENLRNRDGDLVDPADVLYGKTVGILLCNSGDRCIKFASKVSEKLEALRAQDKPFEIVYVSFDEDEEESEERFRSYSAFEYALTFSEPQTKLHLAREFEFSRLPSMAIVDAEGNLLTTELTAILQVEFDGLEEWAAQAKAEEEKKQAEIADMRENFSLQRLGLNDDNILDGDMNPVPLSNFGGKIVGLYFSASWCGPCHHFTPQLAQKYQELVDAGEMFDIILFSSDSGEEKALEYFATMPWKMLRFKDREVKMLANEIFEVDGIPTLVLVNSDSGTVITTEGRRALFSGSLSEIEEREEEKRRRRKEAADRIEFKMPLQVKDPRHEHVLLKTKCKNRFECDMCGESGLDWKFFCKLCNTEVHADCLVSQQDWDEKMRRFEDMPEYCQDLRHAASGCDCQLVRDFTKRPFRCDICHERGDGCRYFCDECNMETHPDCKMDESDFQSLAQEAEKLPDEIFDPRHRHPLQKLFDRDFVCDICHRPGFGFSFSCEDCNFDAHLHCAKDKESLGVEKLVTKRGRPIVELLEERREGANTQDDDEGEDESWPALAKLVTSDTVQRKTIDGLHALHLAAEMNAPENVLMSIINADPGSLKSRDKFGHIPLHHAAEKGASLQVIKLLHEEYPEGITSISDDKSLPLHCALLHEDASEEAIRFFLMQNPDAANAKTHDGWLPLHCAAEFHGSREIISMLYSANPDGIKERDDAGKTPLHWAVEKNSSLEVIEFLLEEYPDALLVKDRQGRLPLHLCVSREDCQIEILRALLDFDADLTKTAVKTKMNGGLLPLHCASQAQASGQIIKILCGHDKLGATALDDNNMLALHHAAESPIRSVSVIDELLKLNPAGVLAPNKTKMTPLHCALNSDAPLLVVKRLLDGPVARQGSKPQTSGHQSSAAAAKGNHGNYPIHIAAMKSSDVGVITALYEAFPKGMYEKNASGARPLHLAAESSQNPKVIALLVEKYADLMKHAQHYQLKVDPTASKFKGAADEDSKGMLPLHYATAFNSNAAVVQSILDLNRKAIDKFCQGKLPIHWAISSPDHSSSGQSGLTKRPSLEIVKMLLDLHPGGIHTRDQIRDKGKEKDVCEERTGGKGDGDDLVGKEHVKGGGTPLHWASICAESSPELISFLIKIDPSIAKKAKDDQGQCPIHWAMEANVLPEDAMLYLVNASGEALKTFDKKGKYPLHYALENGAPLAVIDVLLDRAPEACRARDSNGKQALHSACSNDSSCCLSVITRLLEINTRAASEEDVKGRSPLHLCAERPSVDLDVVQALFDAAPEMIQNGKSGRLPLHNAAQKSSSEVIDKLLGLNPRACKVTDKAKKMLPIQILMDRIKTSKVHQVFYNAVVALIRADMPIHIGNERSPIEITNMGSWIKFICASANVSGSEIPPAVVRELFEPLTREQCKALMDVVDNDDKYEGTKDKRAFDIAPVRVQHIMSEFFYFCRQFELYDKTPPVYKSTSSVIIRAKDHGMNLEYRRVFDRVVDAAPSGSAFVTEDGKALTLKGFEQAIGHLDMTSLSAEVNADDLFKTADKNEDGSLSREEFVSSCERELGTKRHVVIKFMTNKEQYEQELEVRNILLGQNSSNFVVSCIKDALDGSIDFAAEVRHQIITLGPNRQLPLSEYCYGIVMPFADRSLEGIFLVERPDAEHIKILMRELAEALNYCHKRGIVHGDVKALNVLRVKHRLCLTDFDASAEVGAPIGAKFSSGVLPPEMFYELKGDDELQQIYKYWRADKANNSEQWEKVEPFCPDLLAKTKQFYAIKSFLRSKGRASLPYELMPADPSLDVWSFGTVLFHMCTGTPLLPVTRDYDVEHDVNKVRAATWTAESILKRVGEVNFREDWGTRDIRELLLLLLNPDPAKRPTMEQVLAHEFFTGKRERERERERDGSERARTRRSSFGGMGNLHAQILADSSTAGNSAANAEVLRKLDEMIEEQRKTTQLVKDLQELTLKVLTKTTCLENVAMKTLAQIKHTERVLLRGVMETSEVKVPSCFIIVNQRLPPVQDWPQQSSFSDKADRVAKKVEDKVEKAQSWMRKLGSIGSAASSMAKKALGGASYALDHPREALVSALESAVGAEAHRETLWLYLVDQATMKPIVPRDEPGSVYPIEIRKNVDFPTALLPLLRCSLKAIYFFNGAAFLAQCFGVPVPRIPTVFSNAAQEVVGSLSEKSNVAEYDVLQQALDSGSSGQESAATAAAVGADKTSASAKAHRGKPLREFARFLLEKDRGSDFCGLRPVLAADGSCIWTTDEQAERMQREGDDEEEELANGGWQALYDSRG